METSRRSIIGILSAGAVAGFVRPALAADTIKIGMTVPMTGLGASVGQLQSDGAALAVEQVNAAGGVLGRKLELVQEDDQTTNPGIVLAFSRLVNRGDLAVVVSSLRSTQVNAISADARKAAIPVFFGGTDPGLTHSGNPWFFRARPNDAYSAKVIAEFGVHELKKTKWAVVHSTDAFGNNGAKALVEEIKALGITPVLEEGLNNGQTDLTPVVLAIRQSGADVIATYIAFENDVALLARQLKQFGVTTPWIGSPSVVATVAITLAGAALNGTYAVADYNENSSPVAKKYYDEFLKAYGSAADNDSSWAYDSVLLAAAAIKKAGSTDPEKLRAALHAIKDYQGVEGTYNFDQNGDGLTGYNIVRNENGKVIFVRHISFDK